MPEVEAAIRNYIAENILFTHVYPHADDTSFLNEGVIDSMNVLELVAFVEEHFHVSVKDEDIVPDNFDSVSRLAAFVRSRMPSAV